MADARLTIGRVGLDVTSGDEVDPFPGLTWDGDRLSFSGMVKSDSVTGGKALRQQINGYGPHNPDEMTVPVVWSGDSGVDGFYTILSTEIQANAGTYLGDAWWFPFSVDLERVPGWQAPLFEVLASGADRANVHSVASQARSWVAGPGSLDSASLSVVTTTNSTLTAAAGESVKVWNHDGNLYAGDLTYQVDESKYYDGACRVELDYADDGTYSTVVGRQVENLVGRWRLSNGLVRVYPGGIDEGTLPQALDLPGAAGDFCSTPDTAALDIVGNISLAVRVTLDDYTPAADQFLVGKWGAAGQRSYALYLQTDGKLRFSWSEAGTTIKSAVSGAPSNPMVDGQTYWLRIIANGGSTDPDFDWSDADTDDYAVAMASQVGFTDVEDTGDSLASLAIRSGTAAATVGADATGANPAAGLMRVAVIVNTADTIVAHPVFTNTGQFVIAAANGTDGTGKVWTHQANAAVAATGSLGGTVDDYAVDIFDPVANEWQTKVYNLTTGGATPTSLGIAKALTVNHNRPESASVRVHLNATGAPFIDWTVRRGSTVIEGRVEHSHTAAANRAFGVFRKIVEAGSALASDEGIVATSDDADGHKYRIYSPNEITIATTNGGVYLTTAADLMSFGVTSDARDASIASGQFYWAAQRHRQRIVAR